MDRITSQSTNAEIIEAALENLDTARLEGDGSTFSPYRFVTSAPANPMSVFYVQQDMHGQWRVTSLGADGAAFSNRLRFSASFSGPVIPNRDASGLRVAGNGARLLNERLAALR